MNYRIATIEDLKSIILLKDAVKSNNKKIKLDIWKNGYPSNELILSDIQKGHARVVEEKGHIIAFTSFQSSNEEYPNENIPEDFLTFSRLMVQSNRQNCGIGTFFLQHLMQEAQSQHQRGLFITVDSFNKSAIHLYKKMVFQRKGTVQIPQATLILDSYEFIF